MSSIKRTKVESAAVRAISESIDSCDYLEAYIYERDKEPIIDGKVVILKKISDKKEDIISDVPIQVKGRTKDNRLKSKIKFPIDKADLEYYLTIGGAVYFVVYLSEDRKQNKIYYRELTVVKIKNILESNNLSVNFKVFPLENEKKERIFIKISEDIKKQKSYSDVKIPTIDELIKKDSKTIFNIEVPVEVENLNDFYNSIIDKEVSVYAMSENLIIPIPVDMSKASLKVETSNKCIVTVNEKIYYKKIDITYEDGTITVFLGESFKILCDKSGKILEYQYVEAKYLNQRIKDLAFILDVIENKHFNLDDKKYYFDPSTNINNDEFVKQQQIALKYFNSVKELFALMNIEENFNLNTMKENDFISLYILYQSIVLNKIIKLDKKINQVTRINISNFKLLLSNELINEEESTYKIYNYFKSDRNKKYYHNNGEMKKLTTKYSILKSDDYNEIVNLKYNDIFNDYVNEISENYEFYQIMNNDMLYMLLAYDKSQQKNQRLFNEIIKISKFLFDYGQKYLDYEVVLLNKFQVIKRERNFTKEEKLNLIEIAENNSIEEKHRVGAYLLLNNQISAEFHFNLMSDEDKEQFKTFPIYFFWAEE